MHGRSSGRSRVRYARVTGRKGSPGPPDPACSLQALEELLEVLGAILASLIAMFGVGVGTVFAANVGDTGEPEYDLIESFLVVS